MSHDQKNKGAWKGNRDQHQKGEKRSTDAVKRLEKPKWTGQGKHTNQNTTKKRGGYCFLKV